MKEYPSFSTFFQRGFLGQGCASVRLGLVVKVHRRVAGVGGGGDGGPFPKGPARWSRRVSAISGKAVLMALHVAYARHGSPSFKRVLHQVVSV